MAWDEYFDSAAQGLRPTSDFEWYATDRGGRVAVLTSAGFGIIPLSCFRSKEGYYRIAGYFEKMPIRCGHTLLAAGPGDRSFWVAASVRGLFGYDFSSERGQYTPGDSYELITSPDRPLTIEELPVEIRDWLLPIRFAVEFGEAIRLFPEREFEAVNL